MNLKGFISLFAVCLMTLSGYGHSVKPIKEKQVPSDVIGYFSAYQTGADSCSNLKLYENVYQWLGTRYRYRSKKGSGGLDCSGFAKIIYRYVYDKSLTGGSADICPKTLPVKRENLQEGDLVFFKIRNQRVSHVGVYLGNGKFVHAAVRGGVRIDDLSDPYYKRTFYRGGRV